MIEDGSVEYTTLSGINVEIGLYLSHTFDDSVLPPMGPAITIENILVAQLADIVSSKREAIRRREKDQDHEDSEWGRGQLAARGGGQ